MRLKNILNKLLLFSVILVFSSCLKNEICSPVDIQVEAGVFNKTSSPINNGLITAKIDLDSIYAIELQSKNVVKNALQIDKIRFPLNNESNQTTFVFTKGSLKDTLYINYDKQLFFSSIKCGVYYSYSLKSIEYTTNFFKEVLLIKPEVNAISVQNIQLVF